MMKGRIFFSVLGVMILTMGCDKPSSTTMNLPDAESVKLGRVTTTAVTMQSGQTLVLGKGRDAMFWLGNPGKEKVTVTIEGAAPGQVALEPKSQTAVTLQTTAEKQVFQWQGGPLYLSEPYVRGPRKKERNVMLISIDTLRYDHFTPAHMPGLFELFAKSGQRFDAIHTPTPWTLPAHASLLTALYPAQHGVRTQGQKLSSEPVTIGEVFQEKGYYTIAVTEGNYVSSSFGLARGFHTFSENPPSMMSNNEASASQLKGTLQFMEHYLEAAGDAPVFAFLHTYEVHCPFLPRNGLSDPDGYGGTQWLLDNDGKVQDQAVFEKLKALYREEVAYSDAMLAVLVKRLLAEGWIVMLTSDHGEEFGEHGGLLHADNLYEVATHIPLAIAGHGLVGSSERPGSLIDAPATLLKTLDFEVPESWQGRDLNDSNPQSRPVFAESYFFGVHIPSKDPKVLGIWQDNLKLTQTTNFGEVVAELYDLNADPGELQNLIETKLEERESLYLRIQAYLKTNGLESEQVGELTPEQLETMRSLGYIK